MSTSGHIEPRIVLTLLLGNKPSIERKRKIARLLGEKVNRPPFTTGYLDNLVVGRQECSPDGDMHQALTLVMEEVVTALLEKI